MLTNSLILLLSVTLSLKDCKDMAKENNPEMKNAALSVASAREQKSEAFLEYFPTVKATALGFHSLNPLIDVGLTDIIGTSDAAWELGNTIDAYAQENGLKTRYQAMQYGYGATISAIQPLYAGGRIVNGNALAAVGVRAAELQQQMSQRQTDITIEEKYWLVVSLQQKQAMLHEAQSTLDSLLKDAGAARKAGVMTSAEYGQIESRRRELHSNEIKLKGGLALAKMDLFNAVGMEYGATQLDSIVLAGSLCDMPSPDSVHVSEDEMCDRMQEKELLDLQVEAKEYQKKMTVGETLPQVGMGATYGYGKYLNDPTANGMVFVSVQVPLSDWGKTAHKVRRYENEVQKARNERDYLQAQLLLKARQLWINLGTCWEELELAGSSVETARENYRVAQDQLRAGTITTSEFLRTQLDLRQAEDAQTDSQIAYRKALDEYLSY